MGKLIFREGNPKCFMFNFHFAKSQSMRIVTEIELQNGVNFKYAVVVKNKTKSNVLLACRTVGYALNRKRDICCRKKKRKKGSR